MLTKQQKDACRTGGEFDCYKINNNGEISWDNYDSRISEIDTYAVNGIDVLKSLCLSNFAYQIQ